MFKIYCGAKPIHDITDTEYPELELSEDEREGLVVWNISLTKKVNEPDSLVFIIHDTHVYSNYIYPNCEEIRVDKYEKDLETDTWKTPESVFFGRVLSTSINIKGERTITCEGELGYLLDSIVPPFSMENVTNSKAIEFILGEHNKQVGANKRIYLAQPPGYAIDVPYTADYDVNNDGFIFAEDAGLIDRNSQTIVDSFNNTELPAALRRKNLALNIEYMSAGLERDWDRNIYNWSTDGTERTLDLLKRNLTDIYGGILSIVNIGGYKYLKYSYINDGIQPDLTEDGRYISSAIVTLENLIDITYDKTAEERFSLLYPVGADITKTDSLDVKILNGRTWLAFGDGSTVCKTDDILYDLDKTYDNQEFAEKMQAGKVARFNDANQAVPSDSYTGYLAVNGTRYQQNIHTSDHKSYVNLLTEGAKMRTISMAEESETIFKHGGHKESGAGTVQDWDNNGELITNRDKSVVERLYDLFGPAFINTDATEEELYEAKDGTLRRVTTDVAVDMVLGYDILYPEAELSGLRKVDFVTVAVGLNDWLNADSVLGTNEMGRKYSAYLDAAGFTAEDLHKWTSTTAIEDYLEKTKYGRDENTGDLTEELDPEEQSYYDEDNKRIEFKKTMYWQIRFMCMYLKACFPESHIIIFSSFGKKASMDTGGTDEANVVGAKGWYAKHTSGVPTVANTTKRTLTNFYRERELNPYMKPLESQDDTSGEWDPAPDNADPPDNPGGVPHNFVYFDGSWYKKVYINGSYNKATKTTYEITDEGQNPNRLGTFDEDAYLAFAKISQSETVPADSSSSGGGIVDIDNIANSGGTALQSGNESVPEPPGDDDDDPIGEPGLADGDESDDDSEPQTTEKSFPYLVYLSKWSSEKPSSASDVAGHYTGSSASSKPLYMMENAPEIISNPYDVLKENSYSISDLNSAISEVCDELGIVFVDSESATGISVNNYSEIDVTEPEPGDIPQVYTGKTSTMPYDNLTLTDSEDEDVDIKGTKTGVWGESFVDGAYLNDRGQKAMARAVRDAMLECLTTDGTIESVERLAISGSEKPYYAPIMVGVDPASSSDPDVRPPLIPTTEWRAMKLVPDGQLIKIDGVYKRTGALITRKTHRDGTIWEDRGGTGKYDLIDIYGDYNPKAFEDFNMSASMTKDIDITNMMVPKAPLDPIVATIQFDDITDKQELFYAGAKYLYENYGQNVVNITAKAIDMHIINLVDGIDDASKILKVGHTALITALNYGLNKSVFVVDTIVESDDPSDTIITFKSVGSGKYANEQLAANPYGKYSNRLVYSKLSEVFGYFGQFYEHYEHIGGK